MNELYVNTCLGLGDAIIINGMIHTLAEKWTVHIPCYIHNLPSVKAMFMKANVIIHPVRTHEEGVNIGEKFSERLLLGYEGKDFDVKHFDRSFYDQAGMDFDLSWTAFKCPEAKNQVPSTPYPECRIFVHDDSSRGFKIDMEGVRPVKMDGTTMFDWVPVIQHAEEIHCIDSCFALLTDRIPTKAKRKVIHRHARPNPHEQTYRNGWEIL